jgi:hypothetical protein
MFSETAASNENSQHTLPAVKNDVSGQQPQVEKTHLICRDNTGIQYEAETSGGVVTLTQVDKVFSPEQRIFLKVPLWKFLSSYMEIN